MSSRPTRSRLETSTTLRASGGGPAGFSGALPVRVQRDDVGQVLGRPGGGAGGRRIEGGIGLDGGHWWVVPPSPTRFIGFRPDRAREAGDSRRRLRPSSATAGSSSPARWVYRSGRERRRA